MGGGNSPLKSNNYQAKTSKLFFKNLFSKIDFKHQSKGAVLIEFAFCMPILIITIYYINDLATLQRWHSQTQFVAYQMAQMIQSISQNRASKAITANDLRNIVAAAYLSIYPGTTMFSTSEVPWKSFFGHNAMGFIWYVKGNDNGTASVIWGRRFHTADQAVNPSLKTDHPKPLLQMI